MYSPICAYSRPKRERSFTITVLIFPFSISSIMRLNSGRSKLVPLHPSSESVKGKPENNSIYFSTPQKEDFFLVQSQHYIPPVFSKNQNYSMWKIPTSYFLNPLLCGKSEVHPQKLSCRLLVAIALLLPCFLSHLVPSGLRLSQAGHQPVRI